MRLTAVHQSRMSRSLHPTRQKADRGASIRRSDACPRGKQVTAWIKFVPRTGRGSAGSDSTSSPIVGGHAGDGHPPDHGTELFLDINRDNALREVIDLVTVSAAADSVKAIFLMVITASP